MDSITITADRVLSMAPPDEVIDNGEIAIQRGRITYVGPRRARKAGTVMDFPGATAMPGFIDAHVHLTGHTTWDEYRQFTGPYPRMALIHGAETAVAMLTAGFTTVRDMGVPGAAKSLSEAISEGALAGPRILASVAAIGQAGGHADTPIFPMGWVTAMSTFADDAGPKGVIVSGPDDARARVRRLLRQGADFIKIFLEHSRWEDTATQTPPQELSDDELEAIVDEAHRNNRLVAAHAESASSHRRAIAFGADSVEHGMRYVDEETLREMADRGIALVPTMAVNQVVADNGEELGFSAEECAAAAVQIPERQEVVRAAFGLGVPIVVGSSLGNRLGMGQNRLEFQLLSKAGLSPLDALACGTINAARCSGLGSSVGSLEPGKVADVAVFGGDAATSLEVLNAEPLAVFSSAGSIRLVARRHE